jgi:hypothetical protein
MILTAILLWVAASAFFIGVVVGADTKPSVSP